MNKKPILRSITTIDDDESTYNNISFKKRRTSPTMESVPSSPKMASYNSKFDNSSYKNDIDDDEDISNEFFENDQHSDLDDENENENENDDDENIFNSEDDEYYSAISDYELDSKPKFTSNNKPSITSNKSNNNHNNNNNNNISIQHRDDLHSSILDHMKLQQSMEFEDALFESDASDSSSTSSSAISPTSSNFNFIHNVGELKSLEENFQKIINENNKLQNESSTPSMKTPIEVIQEDCTQDVKNQIKFDEFVNYTEDLESSEESDLESSSSSSSSSGLEIKSKAQQILSSKKPSILHYRHDEKHNLAFPDVSTFPIRYDPIIMKKRNQSQKGIFRALNRRAILSGKASEMVGTGMAADDFGLL